jgi:hypothetical protein
MRSKHALADVAARFHLDGYGFGAKLDPLKRRELRAVVEIQVLQIMQLIDPRKRGQLPRG